MIKTKRIYEPASPEDGKRVLVMRYWPRGVSKSKIDVWLRELSPSQELLREWREGKLSWDEVSSRYRAEVGSEQELMRSLHAEASVSDVTLLCGCLDENRCHRWILKGLIEAL